MNDLGKAGFAFVENTDKTKEFLDDLENKDDRSGLHYVDMDRLPKIAHDIEVDTTRYDATTIVNRPTHLKNDPNKHEYHYVLYGSFLTPGQR